LSRRCSVYSTDPPGNEPKESAVWTKQLLDEINVFFDLMADLMADTLAEG
jgi:hypothetical protein